MAPAMTAIEFVLQQPTELPLNITRELCAGRTYIVTGANVGLGLEAARHLVAVGASKVIMASRSVEAGEAAKGDIEASTGVKGVAEVWHLDLSDYDSVRAFASRAGTLDRIEAVIENAGVGGADAKAQGHYLAITVNVISTFLLAILLLPKLRADAAKFAYTPRLSIVTSGTAFDLKDLWQSVSEDAIAKLDANEELGIGTYSASKMLEVLAGREFARLLPVTRGRVIINLVNPGLCATTLSRDAPQVFKDHLQELLNKNGRTAETGSRTLLAGAVAGEDSHGSYMNDCAPQDYLVPDWMDATANKQAWDSLAKELEKIQPGAVAKALE